LLAVPDTVYGIRKCGRELARPIAIPLEQVKRNALRRFLPNTGHAAQTVDQANE
jgi:hypothetical protein